MRASALTGSVQLCVFEQWCEPDCGAPTHLHAVEEVLTVLAGQAEVWVGEERRFGEDRDRQHGEPLRRLPRSLGGK
jgi:mannose-6-phosphate isomerase-like protein (cupin superfamily)